MTNSCEMSVNRGSHCDVGTETCSVAVMTDLDLLGPCEPGTSVILEGIVWSESNNELGCIHVKYSASESEAYLYGCSFFYYSSNPICQYSIVITAVIVDEASHSPHCIFQCMTL